MNDPFGTPQAAAPVSMQEEEDTPETKKLRRVKKMVDQGLLGQDKFDQAQDHWLKVHGYETGAKPTPKRKREKVSHVQALVATPLKFAAP